MASRIKGITIELNGDTTGLQKSLSAVDKSIKDTQSALKDVNKLLQFDPGNTELLTQKQKGLESAISDTKARLEELKNAQEYVEEGSKEWDALQREIIETEQNLDKLEKEYKEFGNVASQQIKNAGKQMSEFGDKVKGVGEGLTKKVTAPIAAIGGAAVVAFNEVDEALDTVTIKTGATGDALKEMQDIVKNIATTIPADFSDIGEAVGEVNTRFNVSGEELEDLSSQFVKFAKLNNTNVSSSIDLVQSAMAAMGVETKDASNFLDLLNSVSQQTGVNVDTLASSMTTNAATLKEMGYSASDAAIFLGNLEKNGIDTSATMAGLKKALVEATQNGQTMGEALSQLQTDMQNANTDTDALSSAIDLFGTKSGPAIANAVSEGRLSFEEFGSTLTDFSGNLSSTFDETLDPIDSLKTSMNELKIIGTEIVESAGPMLTDVFSNIKDTVENLREAWEGLTPKQQEFIINAALIAAAIGPVITLIGTTIMTIASLVTGIGALVGIMGGPFAIVFAAVVVAITGVISVIRILRTHWEEITGFFNTTLPTVKSNFVNTFNGIKTGVQNSINAVVQTVTNGLNEAITFIKSLPAQAVTWGRDIIQGMIDGINEKIQALRDMAAQVAQTVRDFIGFSEPKEGPLSNFHTFMPDMIDLMTKGINEGIPEVEKAMNNLASAMKPQATNTQNVSINNNLTFNGAVTEDMARETVAIVNRELGRLM